MEFVTSCLKKKFSINITFQQDAAGKGNCRCTVTS